MPQKTPLILTKKVLKKFQKIPKNAEKMLKKIFFQKNDPL